MKICLQGAPNARDLGGTTTKYGVIKSNKLVRCGELSCLTDNDVTTLVNYPLQRVVDLRTDLEIANTKDVIVPNVEYVQNPIIESATFGISYETNDGLSIATLLQKGIERMKQRQESPDEHMRILYKGFVNNEFSRNGYGNFLRLLARKPTQGATLWHCSAGKDRVGTCTALLLHCLGASKQTIMQDYLQTNQQMANRNDGIFAKINDYVKAEHLQLVKALVYVDESYLDCFWQEIDKQFGSVDNFVASCNVTQQDIKLLRENYLNDEVKND